LNAHRVPRSFGSAIVRRSTVALLAVALMVLIAALRATNRRQLMERTPSPDDNTITSSVVIRRPVEQVFNFYRDFENLPSFLGDVMKIE
jgi:uncharacterized membrane protein